jgi:hypothetical protein
MVSCCAPLVSSHILLVVSHSAGVLSLTVVGQVYFEDDDTWFRLNEDDARILPALVMLAFQWLACFTNATRLMMLVDDACCTGDA